MICAPTDPIYLHIVTSGGGFLGGLSMLVYMRPRTVREGFSRILVSTVAASLLAALLSEKLFGDETPELMGAAAFLIGFSAWSLLGAVARFFETRQGDDIVSMLKSYQEVSRPSFGGARTEPTPRQKQIDNPDG